MLKISCKSNKDERRMRGDIQGRYLENIKYTDPKDR